MSDDRPEATPPDLEDEALDRQLAELGQLGDDTPADPARLDEIAAEKLRRGTLSDDERAKLLQTLADDASARAAWIEGAGEGLPLDDAQVDRIADAVLARRRDEGLTQRRSRLRASRVAPWLALAAAVIAVAVVLPRLWTRPGPMPPPYGIELSGQLKEVRGDEVPEGVPAYNADSTIEIVLRPPEGVPVTVGPQVIPIAVDPEGHPTVIEDPEAFELSQRQGIIRIRGPARNVAGTQTGTWRLVCVLSSRERPPALGPLERRAARSVADGVEDGSYEWPGGLRAVVTTFAYVP